MYIKELKVTNGVTGEVIRDISFVTKGNITGVKLIVDNDSEGKSNNSGKSTVIKSIDFCLGAKPNTLFEGFGKSHKDSTIENFLYSNKVTFDLTLIDSVENTYVFTRGYEYVVSKSGNENKKTFWTLNGKKITNAKSNELIKNIFFGDSDSKPSFRQLIGKFLRTDQFSLADPIKFYHNTTKSSDARLILDRLFYNNIHTFSLEKDLNLKLNDLNIKINILEKKHGSKNQLKEFILKQEEEINRYAELIELQKPSIISDEYIEEQKKAKYILDEIAYLESEILNIKQSILKYSNDESKIDINSVKLLYNEFRIYNSNISKSFEDTIKFHKSMLDSRIEYLNKILIEKENEVSEKKKEKNNIFDKYNENFFVNKANIESILYKKIQTEENYFRNIKEIDDWESIELEHDMLSKELDAIPKGNESKLIDKFNTFLEEYTTYLYDEKMYLSIPDNFTPYSIKNVTNAGTGKSKAIITVFDLAYISYINEIKKKAPLFSAIDVFEPTDEPTIEKIFNIANSIKGQLIVPVLRSKISFIENINESFVVELSSTEKFFKVP